MYARPHVHRQHGALIDREPALGLRPAVGLLAGLITGLIISGTPWAGSEPFVGKALMFQSPYRVIGTGMWLAIIMAANVWFVIWPNQKRVLGLVAADDASKAKSAALAGIASRTNTLLSIPMLYCMVMQAYLPV